MSFTLIKIICTLCGINKSTKTGEPFIKIKKLLQLSWFFSKIKIIVQHEKHCKIRLKFKLKK